MIGNLYRVLKTRATMSRRSLMAQVRAQSGTVRQKEQQGLLPRPNYAYGMFRAADLARFLGKNRVTVCEFGVATGNGLMAMVELAALIGPETGVAFDIKGFDTGAGLPAVSGYEDHPELWSPGDFAMVNKDDLIRRIDGRAQIHFGDIKDTVPSFLTTLTPNAPLGFISVDVDIYSGTRSALQCLRAAPELYLPAISIYFDDVQFFFANRWCGELRAIEEFNAESEFRKIDHDRSLVARQIHSPQRWHASMYVAHILDHEVRTAPQNRDPLGLVEHVEFLKSINLF